MHLFLLMVKCDSYILFNEFFGTFILALGVSSSNKIDETGHILTNNMVLFTVLFIDIIILMRIGGTDFNPAVTLFKLILNTGIKRLFVSSCVMQVLGASFGFLTSAYLRVGYCFKLSVAEGSSQSAAFAVELTCSFFLYLALMMNDDEENKSSDVTKVIGVVSAVACGIGLGGNVSGAGMNPAIATGANFVRFMHTGKLEEFKYLWIYLLAPFMAAYLSAYFYTNIYKSYRRRNTIRNSISDF